MKYAGTITLLLVPLLFSCFPKKPEIPMIAAPAGPLVASLERRVRAFSGLKAISSMELVKRGKRRVLDTVGIVLDGQRRLRMEVYGPLGQSVAAVVWDGREVLLRMPGSDTVTHAGPTGLERLLGEGLEASELCAVLSGTVPEASLANSSSVLLCGEDGECVLELRQDELLRRVRVKYQPEASDREPRILSEELYKSDKLVYRVVFERMQEIAHYPLPISMVIENPGKKIQLTVQYTDVDVNTLISDEAFVLTDGTGTGH